MFWLYQGLYSQDVKLKKSTSGTDCLLLPASKRELKTAHLGINLEEWRILTIYVIFGFGGVVCKNMVSTPGPSLSR